MGFWVAEIYEHSVAHAFGDALAALVMLNAVLFMGCQRQSKNASAGRSKSYVSEAGKKAPRTGGPDAGGRMHAGEAEQQYRPPRRRLTNKPHA
jgi:hypothetical protein